jgi:glutamate racemase
MHPIGVFDSGVGGLSVLRALYAELPLERFVYLADSGHAPYGERDEQHILQRAFAITRYLMQEHRIKALVVACNTATATAIASLRQRYPTLPIIGIEPAIKPAAQISQTKRIGVMATRGTLGSAKFQALLQAHGEQVEYVLQPCDGLADAIERDEAFQIRDLCQRYLEAMGDLGTQQGQIDTLVLGCTHYPFIQPVLQEYISQPIHFLEGGIPVARHTKKVLTDSNQLVSADLTLQDAEKRLVLHTTGQALALHQSVQRWMPPAALAHSVVHPILLHHDLGF